MILRVAPRQEARVSDQLLGIAGRAVGIQPGLAERLSVPEEGGAIDQHRQSVQASLVAAEVQGNRYEVAFGEAAAAQPVVERLERAVGRQRADRLRVP